MAFVLSHKKLCNMWPNFKNNDSNVAISIGHITQKALNFVSNDSFYEMKFYEKQSMPP